MSEVVERAPARMVVIDPQRMQSAEYLRRDWVVTAEEGTTVDDVLHPGYWAHMARQMSMYDHIEVRVDTGEYLLELVVKSVGPSWAQVALLHHHDLVGGVPVGEARDDEFEIAFKGPVRKWCVIRQADKEILQEKLESKAAATAWATQYESTVLTR